MKIKLLNAFSVNMIPPPGWAVMFSDIDVDTARNDVARNQIESYVGHADTANLFSELLGIPVPTNRSSVELLPGDFALLGQYSGPRLPEGTTKLPEGANIRWVFLSAFTEDMLEADS